MMFMKPLNKKMIKENGSMNMGPYDRMIRGGLGVLMLLNGMSNTKSSLNKLQSIVGGAFVLYGATGFDPLLALFHTNTVQGSETNLFNRIRHAIPGQGIKPQLSQNVMPKKPVRLYRDDLPVVEALAIG